MVALFMFRRTTISVFITVMLRMADMVIDLTALTGLGRAFMAAGVGATAGEDATGIETESMRQNRMLKLAQHFDRCGNDNETRKTVNRTHDPYRDC